MPDNPLRLILGLRRLAGRGFPFGVRRLTNRLSVRGRTTLSATAVVAVALAIVSIFTVFYVQKSLTDKLDEKVRQELGHAAFSIETAGTVPPPGDGGGPGLINVKVKEIGRASKIEEGAEPSARAEPGRQIVVGPSAEPAKSVVFWATESPSSPARTAKMVASAPDGKPRLVQVSGSTALIEQTVEMTTQILLILVPILLLLVAGVTWLTTGRALRPVAAIRNEFTAISAHNLHRRVPVPATRDEIARLAETMNATLDRLENAVRRQREFVADASHELRSPLSTVRTPLEVAVAHPDLVDWPTVAAEALEDLDRLDAITADLLMLARLDAGATPDPVSLDLSELVRNTLDRRQPSRIEMVADLADEVIVEGQRTQLARLLTNLVDNAERYAVDGVRVDLTVENETSSAAESLSGKGIEPEPDAAGWAVMTVSDDGPGIPVEDRERVFERFTRLGDARDRDTGGSGLGLALAREIARHHGGTLVAANSTVGARLVARFPLG